MRYHLPSVNSLRAFEAAARHLSFTRASEELNLTQGAISQQIGRLEKTLGVLLFERSHREIRLTPKGADYFRVVQQWLETISVETAKLMRHSDDTTLRIKAQPTLAMRWLVPRLADFATSNRRIQVILNSGHQPADFDRDDLDGSIEYGDGSWRNLGFELLFPVSLVAVCAPHLADGTTPPRCKADLARHNLLHSMIRPNLWEEWLSAAGVSDISSTRGMRFETSGLTYQAALDGLGVALTERVYVRDDIKAGRLVSPFNLILNQHPIGYYLIYPKQRLSGRPFSIFRKWLLEQARASAEESELKQPAPFVRSVGR